MSKEVTIEMVNAFLTFHTHEWETFKSSCIEKHKAGSPSGRDFEIVSFEKDDGILVFSKEKYRNSLNSISLESCLQFKLKINAVKRLSDGEVFMVGDRLNHGSYSQNVANDKIEKITIEGGDLYFDGDFGTEYHWTVNIKTAKKASPTSREPLFVTFDGVSIYDGDSYYRILDTFEVQGNYNVTKKPSDATIKHSFGKLEAAKDYVLMNKPVLSVNDILSISQKSTLEFREFNKHKLKELAQQKINPL